MYTWTAGEEVTSEKLAKSRLPDVLAVLFYVNASVVPSATKSMPMTGNGRYIFAPTSTEWRVWDSYAARVFQYNALYEYQRTSLSITPGPSTRVLSGSTEYVIASAAGGTTLYRYDADGQNEAAITVSGTSLTGCQRLGYDETTGYVYMQDAANMAGTAIKRFTFSNVTLTYVDTVTLSGAPANAGSEIMWVGATNLCFVDAYPATNRATWQRYGKNSGTQTTTKEFGTPNTNVSLIGWSVRQDDNALIQWHEIATDVGAIGYNISSRLDA